MIIGATLQPDFSSTTGGGTGYASPGGIAVSEVEAVTDWVSYSRSWLLTLFLLTAAALLIWGGTYVSDRGDFLPIVRVMSFTVAGAMILYTITSAKRPTKWCVTLYAAFGRQETIRFDSIDAARQYLTWLSSVRGGLTFRRTSVGWFVGVTT